MHRRLFLLPLLAAAVMASGCGQEDIELAQDDPYYGAAVLFQQRCAACHTLDVVGSQGSAMAANSRERKDGPNFNVRAEDYASVIYAIRNGGFSSGPMPQNIVVGEEAEMVACFVAKYSGRSSDEESPARSAGEPGGSSQPEEPTSGQTGQTGVPVLEEPDCPA